MFLRMILCFVVCISSLQATSHYPVDISFLVADLKFSQEHGVKICEVQQGMTSTLKGDLYSHQDDGLISPNLAHRLATFSINKWITYPHLFPPLLKNLHNTGWEKIKNLDHIFTHPDLLQLVQPPPSNPNSIDAYGGIFLDFSLSPVVYDYLHQIYPNLIFFDAAIGPYVNDKYKMSRLFRLNPDLAKIKPEWNHYPKTYSPELVQEILEEIPGELYVIKPRGAALGKGVIVVSKEDLDETLKMILNKTFDDPFKNNEAYTYWKIDRSETFIIEKYYPSDSIQVPHLGNDWYNPTMRVAFLCIYNNREIECSFLGSYWRIPQKAIDDSGDLNERTKDATDVPYFVAVSDETEQALIEQLMPPIRILYQKMLERNFVD